MEQFLSESCIYSTFHKVSNSIVGSKSGSRKEEELDRIRIMGKHKIFYCPDIIIVGQFGKI